MPVVVGFLLCVALAVAVAHGIEEARVAVVAHYRTRAAAWRKAHPATPHAARAAAVASAVWYGTVPAGKAFVAGWRAEWRAGRDRVRAKYGTPPPAQDLDTPPYLLDDEPEEQPPPTQAQARPTAPPDRDDADDPADDPDDDPEPTPTPKPWQPVVIDGGRANTPRTGAQMSALPTVEIRTVGNVRDAVKAYLAAQAAEAEDAAAELARAQADVEWLTALSEQTAAVLDRDPATAAIVAGLLEAAQPRIPAAQTRLAAADAAKAKAEQALAALAKHSAMEEARDATPAASSATDRYAGT